MKWENKRGTTRTKGGNREFTETEDFRRRTDWVRAKKYEKESFKEKMKFLTQILIYKSSYVGWGTSFFGVLHFLFIFYLLHVTLNYNTKSSRRCLVYLFSTP